MIDTVKILGSLLGNGALSQGSGSSVLGNVLGAALGGGSNARSGGGMADLLGSLMGGGAQQQSSGAGGLGDLLGSVLGGGNQNQQQAGGGLGSLLGGLLGGGSPPQHTNSTADLLGGLFGGTNRSMSAQSGGGSLSDLLGAAVTKYAQSQQPADATQRINNPFEAQINQSEALDQAELLIRAMINAAKADGRVDEKEQQKVLGRLGEVSQDEAAFVRRELAAPLDTQAFIRSIPAGFEQQIYIVSLMAIDLDTNQEAQYLHQLAQGLELSQDLCNQIHEKLGAQKLYS